MKKFLEKNERKTERTKKKQTETSSAKEVKNEKKTGESPKKSQCPQATTKSSITNAQRVMDYFFNEKCEHLLFLLFYSSVECTFILILTFLNLDSKEESTTLTPGQILNIPKLKSKHKRLFKKLKSLKENNSIREYSGKSLLILKMIRFGPLIVYTMNFSDCRSCKRSRMVKDCY